MNPLSMPVLVGAAVVSSPTLYAALVEGTETLETAAVRYVICAVLVWGGLAFLTMLIGPVPRPAGPDAESALADVEETQELAANPEAA